MVTDADSPLLDAFRLGPLDVERCRKMPGFLPTPYGRGQWISLDAARAPRWSVVEELVMKSYRLVALQRMRRALDGH